MTAFIFISINLDACDIYTWGSSFKGMLGHGEETEEITPRVVEALLGRDVRKISCGTEHMLAVSCTSFILINSSLNGFAT